MGCTTCDSCPPCETPLPVTCEPLEQNPSIKRLVGEDASGCKITLINPIAGGLLFLDGSGNIEWRTGASGLPIYLPSLQATGATWTGLSAYDAGNVKQTAPTYVATERWFVVGQSGSLSWVEAKNIFGSGSGFLRKAYNSPFDLSWVTGNPGQLAVVDTNNEVVFKDPGIVIPSNAYPDRVRIRIERTGNRTFDVNFADLIVIDGSGNSLGIRNTSVKTLSLSINGANGLDSGTVANSTDYWVYAIYNRTSGVIAVLASTGVTAPNALPAGFTYYKKIGLLRTNASANVSSGYSQVGDIVQFAADAMPVVYTKTGTTPNAGTDTGTVTQYLPATEVCQAQFRMKAGSLANQSILHVTIATGSGISIADTDTVFGGANIFAGPADETYIATFWANVPLGLTSLYTVRYNGMTNAGDTLILAISGYRLNLF